MYKRKEIGKKRQKKTGRGRFGERLFYETRGSLHGGGLPNCIAYSKGSLHNGDSQRAERVVIRNMG